MITTISQNIILNFYEFSYIFNATNKNVYIFQQIVPRWKAIVIGVRLESANDNLFQFVTGRTGGWIMCQKINNNYTVID